MIHQYKLNGYNIVLDVFSGSIHVVDDVAYDIIEMYESKSASEIEALILDKYKDTPDVNADEIRQCIEDVEELRKNGKLFTNDAYEEIAVNYRRNNFSIKEYFFLKGFQKGDLL